jgi:hypothetical protein
MSFHNRGYLSAEAKQWGENYTLLHQDYFEYFHSVNRISCELLKSAELDCADGPQLFVAGLFVRSLTVFQSAIILAERGIVSELRTMVRSLYELRFQTEAIFKDPVIGARLILKAEELEGKRLEAISKQQRSEGEDPHRAQRELRLKNLPEDLRRMEAQILAQRGDLADKSGRLRPLTIKKLAEVADMATDYVIIYSYLCEATHSSARYLDEMIEYDENGRFAGFGYQQNKKDLLVCCFTAAELHLNNLIRTVQVLKTTPPPGLEQLDNAHRRLEDQLRRAQ